MKNFYSGHLLIVLALLSATATCAVGQTRTHTPASRAGSVCRTTGAGSGRELLANEPEMKQAGGLMDSWQSNYNNQNSKTLDDPTRESNVRIAGGGYLALRDRMVLVDKLEERLQQETVKCQFAAGNQAELSELLREQLFWEQAYGMVQLRQVDPIGDNNAAMEQRVRQHYGLPNIQREEPKQRWTSLDPGYEEASSALVGHCRVLIPENAPNADNRLMMCRADNEFGDHPALSVFDLARAHEKAWSSCFSQNNWVADEHKRLSYEKCMATEDPLGKLCATDRQANPAVAEVSCPKSFVVHVVDVPHLLNWRDRYAGHAPQPYVPVDPAKETVEVFASQSQGLEVALLDAVTASGQSAPQPLHGEVARDIPGSALGLGAIIAIPKGTPVLLSLQSHTGGVTIKLVEINLVNGQTLAMKPQFKSFTLPTPPGQQGPPSPGSGQVLKFSMPPLVKYTMLKTEFVRQSQAYTSSLGVNPVEHGTGKGRAGAARPKDTGSQLGPADDFQHRRIYAKSILPVTVDQDLDLNSALAGATIHGHLNSDMTDYAQSDHPDMAMIPRGSQVYMKVTAKPSDTRPYIDITVTPSYVVAHGFNVPLRSQPRVFHMVGKESEGSSTAPAPATRNSASAVGSALPALGGMFGSIGRQVTQRIPTRRSTGQQPTYENTTAIKTGVIIMINTTEDTFVVDATPATP